MLRSITQYNENDGSDSSMSEEERSKKDFSSKADSFWRVLGSFSQEQLSSYLQFVTGSSRLTKTTTSHSLTFINKKMIPLAHTCSNTLDIGVYDSDEELRDKLLYAIENHRGFLEDGFTSGRRIHEDYDLIHSPPEIERNSVLLDRAKG